MLGIERMLLGEIVCLCVLGGGGGGGTVVGACPLALEDSIKVAIECFLQFAQCC